MIVWLKEKKQDVSIKILIFLISPFFAFLYSLRFIKTKSSYLVFFLTSVFFGMAFSVDSGRGLADVGFDGQAYREVFERFKYISGSQFIDKFIDFLAFNEGKKDYYFDTVAFYISRVTDNYHVMFMASSIFFSYFALKAFKFLTAEEKFDASIVSYILVYFFMHNQIFNINGMRFWTAAWIAVYCIFQIYRNGNKKYFILAFLTPYFHGSYWVFLGVLVIVQFFKRFEKVWVILFFVSLFFSVFAVEFIQYFQSYLPVFLEKLVGSYTAEEVLQQEWSGFGWLPILFKNAVTLYLNILVFLFIKNSKEIKRNEKTKELYLFLLIWVSMFNFLMLVPSLGSRFIQLSYPIIAYIWLVTFKEEKYNQVILFLPIVFFWQIYGQFIRYNHVLSYDFYFSSPVYLMYKYLFVS